MKKNKFLKTLAAISLSAVAAAGCISLAACGHTHHTDHGWEKDSTYHWHVCDEDQEEFDKAEHTYTDGVCVCGKQEPAGGGNGGGGNGGGGSSDTVSDAHTYSYTELTTAMGITDDGVQTTTDQILVTQANLTGANSFLTLTGEGEVKWRCLKKATGGAIEIKNAALSVTFQKAGTITIGFGSTKDTNVSGIALVKADGTYVEATSTTATKVEADETIAEGYVNKAGLYTKTGGQKAAEAATITYTVEAGTYKIYGLYSYADASKPAGAASRGTRIWSIVMANT